MRVSIVITAAIALAVLTSCEFPLTAEIKKQCATAADPAACAKQRYADEFAEERERMFRSGGGV